MPGRLLSSAHLDYLRRAQVDPLRMPAPIPVQTIAPMLRRLWHISGVGRATKAPPAREGSTGAQSLRGGEDLVVGLYGARLPLAFMVAGSPDGIGIHIGTWLREGQVNPAGQLQGRLGVLRSSLDALYVSVEGSAAPPIVPDFARAGLVLGVPTPKPVDPQDGALPLDRLIRALGGTAWAALVLAEPIAEDALVHLRDMVITELREVQSAVKAALAPSPLGDQYTELLRGQLRTLMAGLGGGAWRTGVYLLAGATSPTQHGQADADDGTPAQDFDRLAAVWRGIFSGSQSVPEAVRVWKAPAGAPELMDLARDWALPYAPGDEPPGVFRHPFQHQTLLSSAQLAAYVHLPRQETAGFAVRAVPEFDVQPPVVRAGRSIGLGKVVHRTRETPNKYFVDPDGLSRHVFVAGVTGSGKTNTTFHLLKQAWTTGVPFLVIEPAKSEYRALIDDPALSQVLRIYTLGNERVAPLRLNPFEVPRGIPVGVHLDLLRSAFSAAFGMWTPLPQVLEQCMYAVYRDRGWEITQDRNWRLDPSREPAADERAESFPTLSDLVAKVPEVMAVLGYDPEAHSRIGASLLNRLTALRIGGKGRMLDTQRGLDMGTLLQYPTVLELEGMGDDDDKAFLMGLLLVRLVEHRRAEGRADGLQHLLVVEEAHRLLANVATRTSEEEGNARGKAVESFANLLAEIRAYGQGVLVADQVPVKLAPDVIKNTNLKIAHRLVARDDREALAGAMGMDARQAEALATLERGRAAVFSEGDDTPVLVQVPAATSRTPVSSPPGASQSSEPADEQVAQHMRALGSTPLNVCEICGQGEDACRAARDITELDVFRRVLGRVVLSAVEDPSALDRCWVDVLQVVRATRPPAQDETPLLRSVAVHGARWFAQRRGAQARWMYADTAALESSLASVLLHRVESADLSEDPDRMAVFREWHGQMVRLHTRQYEPFPSCARICRQDPPLCLYRHAVGDLLTTGLLTADWQQAELTDRESGSRVETWQVCLDAAYKLTDLPDPSSTPGEADGAARRVGLCFAQQQLQADPWLQPASMRARFEQILSEALP